MTSSSNKGKLSQEQQNIFDKITSQKRNIFFTGCAGTGKTFLLKKIIEYYRTIYDNPQQLAVTASTGRAAFNVGGSTFHSFTGLGLGKGDINTLLNRIKFNRIRSQIWKTVEVIIIDEVSMLDASFFDLADQVAKSIRKTSKPFGGIQLILTGDLLQLPPVNEGSEKKKRIFQSNAWSESIDECIVLTEVFRQSDFEFIEFLTCIRLGAINEKVANFINKLEEPKVYDSESGPVNLYSTRARTDIHNRTELSNIDSKEYEYTAIDNHKRVFKLNESNPLDNCPAQPVLELKKGAQVMLIKNINKQLVNGTVGVITGFSSHAKNERFKESGAAIEALPIVRFDFADGKMLTRVITREVWSHQTSSGEEIASRRQIPLILAWAVTIHKSQGQTIQRLKVDLSDIFESGQVYTALSRAIGPETLEVVGFDPTRISVDHESLQFCIDNDLI